ncbi:MAG: DsbA family protein [Nocardioides sp.]
MTQQPADRIVLYGDFNCPWSYLAARRAAVLATDGMQVDFRAVEHEPWRPRRFTDSSVRFECLHEEMDTVLAQLLPGEDLPYALAGFVPYTRVAVAAYAEAYVAGVADQVRQLLFEAFWMHGVDLGDTEVVRILLADALRSGSSRSEPVREWGYAVDLAGSPVTLTAFRLRAAWTDQWRDTGKETVPVLVTGDGRTRFGVDAVEWLGVELLSRGLESRPVPRPAAVRRDPTRDLASHSWVSQHGNRWIRDYRLAHQRPALPSVG